MDISEIRESILGKARRKVEIVLTDDEYERAIAVFSERGDEPSEGFAAALGMGLAEMRNNIHEAEEETWFKRYNRLEGSYISLNDKAYRLALDSERMELSRNGWMVENEALRRRVIQLTDEVRKLGGSLPALLTETPPPPTPSEGEAPDLLDESPDTSGPSLWDKLRGRG